MVCSSCRAVCASQGDEPRRVSGAAGLKQTQVYPEGYAEAVASQYHKKRKQVKEVPESSDSDYDEPPGDFDHWDDACLDGVAKHKALTNCKEMPYGF